MNKSRQMKITRMKLISGKRVNIADNIEHAFKDAVTPNAYSYETEKGKLRETADRQLAMFAKLVDILHDKGIVLTDEVESILNAAGNDEYKIEE